MICCQGCVPWPSSGFRTWPCQASGACHSSLSLWLTGTTIAEFPSTSRYQGLHPYHLTVSQLLAANGRIFGQGKGVHMRHVAYHCAGTSVSCCQLGSIGLRVSQQHSITVSSSQQESVAVIIHKLLLCQWTATSGFTPSLMDSEQKCPMSYGHWLVICQAESVGLSESQAAPGCPPKQGDCCSDTQYSRLTSALSHCLQDGGQWLHLTGAFCQLCSTTMTPPAQSHAVSDMASYNRQVA